MSLLKGKKKKRTKGGQIDGKGIHVSFRAGTKNFLKAALKPSAGINVKNTDFFFLIFLKPLQIRVTLNNDTQRKRPLI